MGAVLVRTTGWVAALPAWTVAWSTDEDPTTPNKACCTVAQINPCKSLVALRGELVESSENRNKVRPEEGKLGREPEDVW